MKLIQLKISETDLVKFGLKGNSLRFPELVKIIGNELVKENLEQSIELAEKYGLSEMSMEEITNEVKEVRKNAKSRH